MDGTYPIKKVALFKHGVAFVQREFTVTGNKAIHLYFKSSEMNDVLKSLTVLDYHGGVISSITYPANKSVQDQLNQFSIHIPTNNPLTGLIQQCQGSRVKITRKKNSKASQKSAERDIVEGTIIGTEELVSTNAFGSIIKQPHVTLLSASQKEASLQTVNLLEIEDLEILDENLKKDLEHILNVLISSKKKDSICLTIYASGEEERKISISYIISAPVWKCSYRVLLPQVNEEEEKSSKKNEQEADKIKTSDDNEEKKYQTLVQAWSMVDNTMDEDWDHIRLVLVAGMPISFIHDLFSPRYKKRPIVKDAEQEILAPPVLEAAHNIRAMPSMARSRSEMKKKKDVKKPLMMAKAMSMSEEMEDDNLFQMEDAPELASKENRANARRQMNADVNTKDSSSGDLFHYEIKHAVTVKRNAAALVPIFSGDMYCKPVIIYNQSIRDKNPMKAIHLKNSTNLSFEGGPITVLEDENYAGESMLEVFKPGQEKFLPYAVDLSVCAEVDTHHISKPIHFIEIKDGLMKQINWREVHTTYSFTSSSKKQELILEHKFNKGLDVFDTPPQSDTTENYYRYKITLDANKMTSFTVKEKKIETHVIHIIHSTKNDLKFWVSNFQLDKAITEELEDLMKSINQLEESKKRMENIRVKMSHTLSNQTRLRNHLASIKSQRDTKNLRSRYVNEMESDENKIDELRKESEDLKEQLNSKTEEVNLKLKNFVLSKNVN